MKAFTKALFVLLAASAKAEKAVVANAANLNVPSPASTNANANSDAASKFYTPGSNPRPTGSGYDRRGRDYNPNRSPNPRPTGSNNPRPANGPSGYDRRGRDYNERTPDFCARSDYDCYEFGQPDCCSYDDCDPDRPPPCDQHDHRDFRPAPTPNRSPNPRPSAPGGDFCTWSPDYDCYRNGWPQCCQLDICPSEQPACELNPRPSPNRRPPTRRPTRRPSPNRRPPTRRPTRRPSSPNRRPPTRRPTRRPTKRPTNRRPTDECIGGDERPRPVRDGYRFRFNLVDGGDGQCVDRDGHLYEWGRFEGCVDFGACADLCVNDVPDSLAFDDGFRGIDYDCATGDCNCLYDEGTLDNRNSGDFDRTNRNEQGRFSIDGTRQAAAFYCGSLVGSEALDVAVSEA